MFAALSQQNEVIVKSLRLFIALGPAAYIKHANATIINIL